MNRALDPLRRYSGVRVDRPHCTVPAYTGPTAAAGVDESTAHGEYDAIGPVNLTDLRYGRWSLVSALANVVDNLQGINQMHAWEIARDLDLLAVTAVQNAASTPVALGADLETQVRETILSVAAATYTIGHRGYPRRSVAADWYCTANAGDLASVPMQLQRGQTVSDPRGDRRSGHRIRAG